MILEREYLTRELVGGCRLTHSLEAKFSAHSPYNFVVNNPILLIDPDGKEPKLNNISGLTAMLNSLKGAGSTLSSLYKFYGGNTITAGGSGSTSGDDIHTKRYLYSKKWGWMDMRHFAGAAYQTDKWYLSKDKVLDVLEGIEKKQDDLGQASGWSYEDLTSNLLGAYFETYLASDAAKGKTVDENLEVYLTELGFVDDVTIAPNIKNIPQSEKSPASDSPKNSTYTPSYTTESRDGELDEKIGSFLEGYMKETNVLETKNPDRTVKNKLKTNISGGCFISGTKVTMWNNELKDIEEIHVGDLIKTYNVETKKTENNIVQEIISPIKDNLIKIQFKNKIVNTNTSDHPYYVVDKGWCSYDLNKTDINYGWKVNQLEVGDICLYYENGKIKKMTIISIQQISGKTETYNLSSVKNNMNFFANGILVHNKYLPTKIKNKASNTLINSKKAIKTITKED